MQLDAPEVALALWCAAIVLWLLLTYGIFTALTVIRDKPDLAAGINGGWLTAVVATQPLVALGTVARWWKSRETASNDRPWRASFARHVPENGQQRGAPRHLVRSPRRSR